MLVASIADETENFFASTICESCGEKFPCGANSGECWCFRLAVAPEKLIDLREKYKNCLCENCLGKYDLLFPRS